MSVNAQLAQVTSQKDRTSNFRYDISGLRTIGVGSVVAYHFGVPYLQGGFVGVDVFFAISGYLMTQIILGGIDKDKFSLASFYKARVYRILPALIVVVLSTVIVSSIFTGSGTASSISRAALSTLLFISNFHYATLGGYFAAAAETNWFLHSWTLSVEWQFYMLYPLVLLILHRSKWAWKNLLAVMILTSLALFFLTLAAVAYSPKAELYAFYMLPTRAWELLAGGCVALLPRRLPNARAATALSVLGQSAILFAILAIKPSWSWPSAWTLFPVLGCCLVLFANRQRGWLTSAPAQMIGAWSYSIYLWHWPIVAAFHYFAIPVSLDSAVAGIALSTALGALSYTTVERLARDLSRGQASDKRKLMTGIVVALSISLIIPYAVIRADGFRAVKLAGISGDTRAAVTDYADAMKDWRGSKACPEEVTKENFIFRCHVPGKGHKRVLVIGDSHAEQFIPRIASAGYDADVTILYRDGCLPAFSSTFVHPQCSQAMNYAFAQAQRGKYDRVILLFYWQNLLYEGNGTEQAASLCEKVRIFCYGEITEKTYRENVDRLMSGLSDRLRTISKQGTPVVLVGPYPTADIFAGTSLHNSPSPSSLYEVSVIENRPRHLSEKSTRQVRAIYAPMTDRLRHLAQTSGSAYVDPIQAVCNANCSAYIGRKFRFWDSHHLRDSVVKEAPYKYMDGIITGASN